MKKYYLLECNSGRIMQIFERNMLTVSRVKDDGSKFPEA
jgi:hypothetical protein